MSTEYNKANSNNGGIHVPAAAMVDAFYGVADDRAVAALHAHLAECQACSERWEGLAEKRSASASPVEVSPEFLAAQRRAIYARIERPQPEVWRVWVPVATAAIALTAAVVTFRPAAEPPRQETVIVSTAVNTAENDAQLFSDVYLLEQSYEPSATAPIQALFLEESGRNDAVEERN
ncbi:MAG: hypothetical protein ABL995_09190 [Bryobacteraceae bacterium]